VPRQNEAPPVGTGQGLKRNSSGNERGKHSAEPDRDQRSKPESGDDRRKAAKHAEIAARYDRARGRRTWEEISPNKRMKELQVFRRLWTKAGRSTVKIDDAIKSGRALEMHGRALGAALNVTFADYKAYGQAEGRHPSTIRPRDATTPEIKAYLHALQLPRKAAARRKRRIEEAARRQQANDLDCRASAILAVTTLKPEPVSRFMKALARSRAFMTHDGKRFLTGNSLRQAIIRETKRTALKARIEITEKVEKHGRRMLMIGLRPK
jgi:stage V sporulation protein SpoVS